MFDDKSFVYEVALLDLSASVRAAFVAELMIAFGRLVPGPGVRVPPPHMWPLRWWSSSLVTFVSFRDGGLSGRALVLSPRSSRVPREVFYLDKLWSAHPGRGAGRTLMNVLVMMAGEEGSQLRWRARDPGFYKRWAESRTVPLALTTLNDRDYVHIGLGPSRAWEAEDVGWLRMPGAWAQTPPAG